MRRTRLTWIQLFVHPGKYISFIWLGGPYHHLWLENATWIHIFHGSPKASTLERALAFAKGDTPESLVLLAMALHGCKLLFQSADVCWLKVQLCRIIPVGCNHSRAEPLHFWKCKLDSMTNMLCKCSFCGYPSNESRQLAVTVLFCSGRCNQATRPPVGGVDTQINQHGAAKAVPE